MPASSASAVPSGFARWGGFPTPSANRSWRMPSIGTSRWITSMPPAIACCSSRIDSNCRSFCGTRRTAPIPRAMARSLKCGSIRSMPTTPSNTSVRNKASASTPFATSAILLWHSLVFSAADRESAYVIDGLMHNDVVKSDIHSTDAFGYTEAIFATSHLTGFSYAPRFKNLKRQRLYIFRSRQSVDRSAWKIKPAAYCDEQHIIQFWDDILRFIATIKLKETTASDIFRRLNSYSKQHGLYHALKAFGQILKSIFILRVIDEPGLRMSIEKVLSGIEHVHAFTRAVSVGNPREFLQAEKEDQEMAEACKRLIKNCIICWNYLYLSQKLAEIDDPAKREELLQAMAHGSAAAWGHLNLLGEYDFSEDKLQDSVGIKLPKLTD